MSAPHGAGFQFAIDRGGTFTDVFARCPDGRVRVLKLLSEDPKYDDAPTEGIRRVLRESGVAVPDRGPLDSSLVQWIRMGTTVATNALLQRRGERTVLLVTRGFRDLLHIGTQARPDIFDLEVSMPPPLYEAVIEVDERLIPVQPRCRLPGTERMERIRGRSGDEVLVQKPPDLEALRVELQRVWDQGVRSVAVLLLHSYTCPSHEALVGSLAESLGFSHVSLSSSLSAMARAVPRGMTACADAYLSPSLRGYLRGFRKGFSDGLEAVPVLFMRSDGGLTPMAQFSGARAVLSGPAGGVVGYSRTAFRAEDPRPVIGFDMGGTSTDVSRFAGRFEHVYDGVTAGVSIQTPQLNIQTVAAGGGSRLFYRSGLFVVGPESAGADPGPACYRKGGPATVTDANLVLGRLLPHFFPRIFGPAEDEALSVGAARGALQGLAELLAADDPKNAPRSLEEVAMGFIRVANEAMSRPIRALTEARGHAVGQHVLACFGGAGGQHACAIARTLGMDTVFIHKHSGVLSAFGLALADVVHEAQEPSALRYEPAAFAALDERIRVLSLQCCRALGEQGFDSSQIRTEPFLHLRYAGTDCALMCSAAGHPPTPNSCRSGDFGAAFAEQYLTEFGFTIPGRAVLVDDIRVRGVGSSGISEQSPHPTRGEPCGPEMVTRCYFEGGFLDTPVFLMERLGCEQRLPGPAIIIDRHSTIVVEPGCVAELTPQGDIRIAVGSTAPHVVGPDLDPVLLSLFSHRFMSIAEQMGRVLQRSAISTNVKERLDFSCAVFAAGGQLVSNAPHIPVHLGAMQDAVQFQIRSVGADLQPGDVLLSNHPIAGGSHLPDLTVITPVFYPDLPGPVFWVASRGHHADIGGLTPGSMPPHSKTLSEEGAVFISFYLVRAGVFQEEAVSEVLVRSGTRALRDNVADLRAQVAANHKGATLLRELVATYGLSGVTAYMEHIRTNAERSVRALLRGAAQRWGAVLEAEDRMDDGTPICLRVTVDPEEGSAVFDFSGSGPEVYGNCNAPRAITLSALIYCLRCMVGHDIPLNQGCLAPVRVILPEGSILSPSPQAAVVGGNVLTSQRIVDVVLRAFGACAASQGCMNNVTFGDASVGYYETVAGGAGAGPHWDGRSGVHSHMTNTRITDPEILELRYPVVLRRFELRRGSGGSGRFRGGDGVRRELQFRSPMVLSVLSDRRVLQPYGMDGGAPGSRGVNLLQRCDGRTVSLGGRACVDVGPGDTFILLTPGGGGFGSAAPPGGAVGPGGAERRGASEYWGGNRAP